MANYGQGRVVLFIVLVSVITSNTRSTATDTEYRLKLEYPEVHRDKTVVDNYHGTNVSDPYRWLEDLDSIETKAFTEAQTILGNSFLESISTRPEILDKLTGIVNYPKFSAPILKGSRYFSFHNPGLLNHDVFQIQEDLNAEPRTLLDPNALSEDGSIGMGYYRAVSPNSELFLYTLSQSGSDWLTAKLLNITSGIELSDTLEFMKWPEFSWASDGSGFFYARFPVGDDGEPLSENSQIYFHTIGTNQAEDTFITDTSENPSWFLKARVADGGEYLLVIPQPDFASNSVYLASVEGAEVTSELKELFPVDLVAKFVYVTSEDNKFIFLSDYNAPNAQLIQVTVDLSSDQDAVGNITVLVAEHEKDILKWALPFDGDKIVLCYFEDVKHKVEVRNMNTGALVAEIPLEAGIVSEYELGKENKEFFFKFENLVTPGKIYRCVSIPTAGVECAVYRELSLGADTGINLSDFTMKQVFYPSKDGTMIPMYIAHKENFTYDGTAPALLYGYGGFNVDTLPSFSPFYLAFIDYFNGVFASANIRGGAEYGEKWHEAGMVHNKQNVFDDFQAGAEYLIQANYTRPSRLSIQGSSNGGLLVGDCVNQRPDLFGVALPDVGLLDMLRFQKFTIGFAWCSEYGCSDNETEFQTLFKYSPLHNIKLPIDPVAKYPSIMVSTADHDDRVVPSHSFKYVAELQYTIGRNQTNPIILRVEKDAGHNGEDKPTIKKIADYTDSFAFIADHLSRI